MESFKLWEWVLDIQKAKWNSMGEFQEMRNITFQQLPILVSHDVFLKFFYISAPK